MDWDVVGQGIQRYGRWREIFLGIGLKWWQVGPLYDHTLKIKVSFKVSNSNNLRNSKNLF